MNAANEKLYQEKIYLIKEALIRARGEKYYYDLIGDRIEFIVKMRTDTQEQLDRAKEYVEANWGIKDVDENKVFRQFILNETIKLLEYEDDELCEEKLQIEVALMDLAMDVYEKM